MAKIWQLTEPYIKAGPIRAELGWHPGRFPIGVLTYAVPTGTVSVWGLLPESDYVCYRHYVAGGKFHRGNRLKPRLCHIIRQHFSESFPILEQCVFPTPE